MADLVRLQKALLARILSIREARAKEIILLMKRSYFPQTVLFKTFSTALILVVLLCSGLRSAPAQEPDDVVRTETSLVQLNVGVVDPRGRSVTSLSRNDFTV